MTQLVLQPCAFGTPLDHFYDTVLPPVLLAEHTDLLSPQDLHRLEAVAEEGRVALWGIVPNNKLPQYRRLRDGARVVFINQNVGFYTGTVTHRFHNESLAERLWKRDDDGRTWEYMYSIAEGQAVEVDGQLLKEALGYESTANFQGFTVVDDVRARRAVALIEGGLQRQRTEPLPENPGGGRRQAKDLTLGLLTDPAAVVLAIQEFDRLGRDAFLDKYKFGRARSYILEYEGREYDSKAIAGAALAYQSGVNRPLPSTEFSGGESGAASRLRSLGFTVRGAQQDDPPETGDATGQAPPTGTSGGPRVELVDSERNSVTEFERAPASGMTALRAEARLVERFEDYLRHEGHSVGRLRVVVPGDWNTLVTDTYDVTDGLLYEAKSATDRATIRLAVGQLLDYLRFVPNARGRLLLPGRPKPDLIAFIHSVGFGLVFADDVNWVTLLPEPLDASVSGGPVAPDAGLA